MYVYVHRHTNNELLQTYCNVSHEVYQSLLLLTKNTKNMVEGESKMLQITVAS